MRYQSAVAQHNLALRLAQHNNARERSAATFGRSSMELTQVSHQIIQKADHTAPRVQSVALSGLRFPVPIVDLMTSMSGNRNQNLDIYLDKEDSEFYFSYLDGTEIQRAEAALRQNDDMMIIRSIFRFRLYGSIDSLRLLLLNCEKKGLVFLYTAVTNKQCSAQWDQTYLIKNIEDVITFKRTVSVHNNSFDDAIISLRQRESNRIASVLLDAMCGQLRDVLSKNWYNTLSVTPLQLSTTL